MKKLDRPKRRWNAPAVLALAVTLLIISSIFALGFWAGVSSLSEPVGKISSQPFEKDNPIGKMSKQPFVKMPEELP